jgi:hypothetical protein
MPLVLFPFLKVGLDVVGLAKDPNAAGPLARSTTQESNVDIALGVIVDPLRVELSVPVQGDRIRRLT